MVSALAISSSKPLRSKSKLNVDLSTSSTLFATADREGSAGFPTDIALHFLNLDKPK